MNVPFPISDWACGDQTEIADCDVTRDICSRTMELEDTEDTVTGLFGSGDANESWCFDYSVCTFKYVSKHVLYYYDLVCD